MQLFEKIFLSLFLCLVISILRKEWAVYSQILVIVCLVAVLLNCIFEFWRWPIIGAYVGFVFVAYFVIWHINQSSNASITLVIFSSISIFVSSFLIFGLPIREMPKPSGPFTVGLNEFFIQDSSRVESYLGLVEAPRELYIKVWYPGYLSENATSPVTGNLSVATLYEEAFEFDEFSSLSKMLSFLQEVKTHSFWNLPIADEAESFPVLIYNHAIVSYPSENTLLMEHLASNGYVVFSINHTNQQAAYERLQRDNSSVEDQTARTLARINDTDEVNARVAISLEYFESSVNTNKLVEGRVTDTRFLLENLQRGKMLPAAILSILEHADLNHLGVIGHSTGGAVSGEFCKLNVGCTAGVNLDGGQFGQRQREPFEVPFMMLSNSVTRGWNDFLYLNSNSDYYDYVFQQTKHGDFSDQPYMFPIMKWLGVLGKADTAQVMENKNSLVLSFFDKYLKGESDNSALRPTDLSIETRIKQNGRLESTQTSMGSQCKNNGQFHQRGSQTG